MIKNKLECRRLISGKLLTGMDGNFHQNIQEPPERMFGRSLLKKILRKLRI